MNINTYGQGKDLVLLHGWGFDQRIWLPFIDNLIAQFKIWLVDLPGFGSTPFISWETFKNELLKSIPPQAAMLGWSLGGLYATRFALETQQVSHLINIASSPYFLKEKMWPGITTVVLERFKQRLLLHPEEARREFIHVQMRNDALPEIPAQVSVDGLQEGLLQLESWDFREPLKRINIPTAYIFGHLDSIVPSALHEVMRERYSKFEYLMIDKAAHMPFLSNKSLLEAYLRRFIGVQE